jgi:hypothetical protein
VSNRGPSTRCSHTLRLVLQGIVYGKPVNQGITQLKPTRNLRNVAEERAGRKLGGLRVLNSYWINQVCCAQLSPLQDAPLRARRAGDPARCPPPIAPIAARCRARALAPGARGAARRPDGPPLAA